MKTFFAVAAVAVLAPSALAEKCDYAVVAPQLHSLAPEITACYEATGYYLAPPPAPPTAEQQSGICSKCTAFIDRVSPMQWPDCTLNLAGTDQTLTAFFNSVTSPCKATAAPTPGPTSAPTPTTNGPTPTDGSSPTSGPTSAPSPGPSGTQAPAPTTSAPDHC